MNWTERQTLVDISGTSFPRVWNQRRTQSERFWYVKDEFIKHSHSLLTEGQLFSCIAARREGTRWVCDGKPVTKKETAWFLGEMRLFYLKGECMSIPSLCRFMEMNVANEHVQLFFRHMQESWEEDLGRPALLLEDYSGQIRTNKQLIDAVLYSDRFHSQEKYKKRYDNLLAYMDESLILMSAYNAMHSGYHMNQISCALSELREDNFVILLPDHLRHEWDKNCPYKVIR